MFSNIQLHLDTSISSRARFKGLCSQTFAIWCVVTKLTASSRRDSFVSLLIYVLLSISQMLGLIAIESRTNWIPINQLWCVILVGECSNNRHLSWQTKSTRAWIAYSTVIGCKGWNWRCYILAVYGLINSTVAEQISAQLVCKGIRKMCSNIRRWVLHQALHIMNWMTSGK